MMAMEAADNKEKGNNKVMGDNKDKSPEDLDDDELDELMMAQSSSYKSCKHRGYGNYERNHIYRGAVAKAEHKE